MAGAAGATVAAIGNALEDALGVDAGWMLFVIGAIATPLALLALGALIAAAVGFFAADAGGVVLTGSAFFVLAWQARRAPIARRP